MSSDVSIVMPVWQTPESWLRAALGSALDDPAVREVIVVDDGNDDPVEECLGSIDTRRVRLLRIEHGGQGAALDAGIAAARGSYIRFADSDDVVARRSTSRLLTRAAGRNDVITYGSTVVCDELLRPVRSIESRITGDATIPCLLGRFDVRHVAMLFPRHVVERAGSWSSGLRVSGDWDFVLRTLEHATVDGDTEPAVYYRRHERSLTGAADVETGERDRELVIQGFLGRNPRFHDTEVERAAWAALLLDRAVAYANVGETRRALNRLGRGASLAPGEALSTAPRVAGLLVRRAVRSTRHMPRVSVKRP